MRRKTLPVLVAALAACCVLQAQSVAGEGGVPTYAPASGPADGIVAPTRVRVGVREGHPVVQWVDHPTATGYLVYRHDAPIDAAEFDRAVEVGRVAPGVGEFEDAPERDGRFFYAVLALDSGGKPVIVLEPMRNATISGLSVAGTPKPAEPSPAPSAPPPPVASPEAAAGTPAVAAAPIAETATSPETEPETPAAGAVPEPTPAAPSPVAASPAPAAAPATPAAGSAPVATTPVRAIAARVQEDAIRVSWTASTPGSRLVLYRGVSPIVDVASLLAASTVASFEDLEGYILDYPVPGIPYYYAIIDDEGLRTGRIVIARGANATSVAAEVPAGLYRVGLPEASPVSRSIPLPFLYLSRAVSPDGRPLSSTLDLPARRPLSAAGQKAAAELLGYAVPIEAREPELVVLPEDRVLQGSGDEYTLRLIAAERLLKSDWKAAADELARYLSLRRDPALEARARFYRGQALAKLGEEREAFFELLLAEPWVGSAGDAWVDWILSRLRAERIGD
ncbi:MAG TPA: hypothetical protein PKW82_03425 [Spirochaetales bacterium]|nr:hypothetical protein [Spirochaetales bacterium]